jgi:hypothetical protein
MLKGSEANIIKSFIIHNHTFIGVFYKLMKLLAADMSQEPFLWTSNQGEYGESFHNSVWVFFSDLGDKESSHTGSSTTTE